MSAMPTPAPIMLKQVSKGYKYYRRPSDRLRELLWRKSLAQIHWALQELTVTIQAGETFGLVGENGAGKSTFLKLVAGTCKATTGKVLVHGRVTALLELGIGFHIEESGRENVYLMGALAGISPAQMEHYYTEIAAFSELSSEALARPVKTYSSGMFMRLAFATATAVDPDILVIDEALSVGDMHFQKKSLDRIMEFRERGKTVLFCSHNMYQIRTLCARAAWLHEGQVQALGDTEHVVTAYESYIREKEAHNNAMLQQQKNVYTFAHQATVSAVAPVQIKEVTLSGVGTDACVTTFQSLEVCVELTSHRQEVICHIGVVIVRNDKENVFGTSTQFEDDAQPLQINGYRQLVLRLPELLLLSGNYWLSVYVLDDSGIQVYDMAEQVCPFTVHNPGQQFGLVYMPYQWIL